MKIPVSVRSSIAGCGIFKELAEKRSVLESQGFNIYDFSIEMPDMPPSLDIRESVSGSATKAWNYSYSLTDMPQLRDAVFSWYHTRYSVTLDPADEIMSAEGKEDALFCLLNVLTDPGDKVLLTDPCSPYYLSILRLSGCVPVFMPLSEENDYLPVLSDISPSDAASAKAMIISYPNDPTSATAPDSFYEALIGFASKNNIAVIHDNSYSDISYDGITGKSFLYFDGAKEIGAEINSLSSSYSAYGLKAAFIVGNKEIISACASLKACTSKGSFYPVQYGIIAALTSDQSAVEETISLFEYRRDTMLEALEGTGLKCAPCRGTPFMWVKLPEHIKDDRAFSLDLLEKAHVLVTPGSAFGSCGKGYIRIALNRRRPFLLEACEAMKRSGLLDTCC